MISAVILTKNEEKNIARCLKNLLWCDEILLIDDYSTDNTLNVAKRFKAKVYSRGLNNDFADQRNFGLTKATHEWILFIDADEIVSKELAREIREEIASRSADGYLLKRVGWIDEWVLRLAKKGAGKWRREVHEVWDIKGNIKKLHSPLLHSPSEDLFKYLAKINFYSSLHAKSNISEGKNVNLIKIVFWPVFKFILNFIVKRGYTDGVHGFVVAIMMSFHSFLAWSKQWELQKDK